MNYSRCVNAYNVALKMLDDGQVPVCLASATEAGTPYVKVIGYGLSDSSLDWFMSLGADERMMHLAALVVDTNV